MSSGVVGEQVTAESLLGVPCLDEPVAAASSGAAEAGGATLGGPTPGDPSVAGEASVAERVAVIVAEVAALHEGLAADVAWRLSEPDLLQVTGTLVRLRAGVDAAYLRAVAEVDRRRAGSAMAAGPAAGPGAGHGDGPRGARSGVGSSTESFLRTSAPLTPGQARSDVAAARALGPTGSLREMEPLLAGGDITRAHVDVATTCLDKIPVHLRTEDADRVRIAAHFAGLAPTRHALTLKQDAAVLLAELAPEVADRFDPTSHERRFLDWTTDSTGMLLGRFALDPAAGATLRAAVDASSAPAPSQDGVRDPRQARERRADALVQVADTALGVAGPVRGERPRIVVHATAEQLTSLTTRTTPSAPGTGAPGWGAARPGAAGPGAAGWGAAGPGAAGPFAGRAWTEAGTRLDPHTVRRIACDAVLQRVVWDRDAQALGSELLDLGRTARLADVHLRRALAARDRGCIIPGCGAPPAHCDAHHIVHWADGGLTSLHNTCQLCGSHHTAVHDGTWQVRMGPDGIPEAIPPERIDPLRRPRRAPHHDTDKLLTDIRGTARTQRPRDRPPEPGDQDGGRSADRGGSTADLLGAPSEAPDGRSPPDGAWRPPGWDPDEPYPF